MLALTQKGFAEMVVMGIVTSLCLGVGAALGYALLRRAMLRIVRQSRETVDVNTREHLLTYVESHFVLPAWAQSVQVGIFFLWAMGSTWLFLEHPKGLWIVLAMIVVAIPVTMVGRVWLFKTQVLRLAKEGLADVEVLPPPSERAGVGGSGEA